MWKLLPLALGVAQTRSWATSYLSALIRRRRGAARVLKRGGRKDREAAEEREKCRRTEEAGEMVRAVEEEREKLRQERVVSMVIQAVLGNFLLCLQ